MYRVNRLVRNMSDLHLGVAQGSRKFHLVIEKHLVVFEIRRLDRSFNPYTAKACDVTVILKLFDYLVLNVQ